MLVASVADATPAARDAIMRAHLSGSDAMARQPVEQAMAGSLGAPAGVRSTGKRVQVADKTAVAERHVHRRPKKADFEGKTIKRFKRDADNHWRIWFTDGTGFAIQSELFSGLPCMELCDVCIDA